MDPFMDPVHGLPLWTTPHFVKLQAEKSLDTKEGSDPLSYLDNFSNCLLLSHLKKSGGSNGIQTHDLCDAGAVLYKLNFEATQLGAGQFVGQLICSGDGLDK